MKKYINALGMILLAIVAMTSCKEEEGTTPGTDGAPAITLYQYAVEAPEYNPDNDVRIRIAANNQVTEAYYLAETTADKNAHVEADGETGYMTYVVENGTKIEGISGESSADITLTNLQGEYTITVVGVNGSNMASQEVTFAGLAWEDVVTGTYVFGTTSASGTPAATILGQSSVPTTLQVCTTDPTLYRFKDVFGEGYSMKINLIDKTATDSQGEYQFFRVPSTLTSYTYGSYGSISVSDIGYWQGNDAFVTDNGYESGMYANHNCFILIAYQVSAGALGYGYDEFIAD